MNGSPIARQDPTFISAASPCLRLPLRFCFESPARSPMATVTISLAGPSTIEAQLSPVPECGVGLSEQRSSSPKECCEGDGQFSLCRYFFGESTAMRDALEKMLRSCDTGDEIISRDLIEGLLLNPSYEAQSGDLHFDINQDPPISICLEEYNTSTALWGKLIGVPRRPFYVELSRRLKILCEHSTQQQTVELSSGQNYPFLPASHFGMTELLGTSNSFMINLPKTINSVEECTKWLRNAGNAGIVALLGCRCTVGSVQFSTNQKTDADSNSKTTATAQYLLPPPIHQLILSSRKFHKPNTNSKLTVAARALAKHAHRGEEGFFGVVKGSESERNELAEKIVRRLISEAAWINIHCFGGVDESRPVMEVRTVDGYGARWSAVWKESQFSPEEVEFRGFLEPQMDDGHEKRWRH